jgi:hypothetical protein
VIAAGAFHGHQQVVFGLPRLVVVHPFQHPIPTFHRHLGAQFTIQTVSRAFYRDL